MNINKKLWGMDVGGIQHLSELERTYINSLPETLPDVEWVWSEMDRVWDELGLDNRQPLHQQSIQNFYKHPVWIMNGIFTSADSDSKMHREAIALCLKNLGCIRVADFGGGSGELAVKVASMSPEIFVDVIEPFPSALVGHKLNLEAQVDFFECLSGNKYDAILAQDVLEHIEDPIELAVEMAEVVKEGGYLIFANCFHPVIKCHLPSTFHLRHTFLLLMKMYGLEFVCRISGVSHALVFRKIGKLNPDRLFFYEKLSKYTGGSLNSAAVVLSKLLRVFK